MDPLLALTLGSMQRDMSKLDQVASNLANVSTPGFKRQVSAGVAFSESVERLQQERAASPGVAAAGSDAVPVMVTRMDPRPGTIRATGEPLDVALLGPGYLEVTTDQGTAYTRAGSLRIDGKGRLVTVQGYPVAGRSGDVHLSTRTPVIDSMGRITEPDAPAGTGLGGVVAQLKIVRLDDERSAVRLGGGLLSTPRSVTVLGDVEVQVRQGALEGSNVSPAEEMVQLTQAMRHFESMQRISQGYDEMLGAAIRKLGETS